MAKFTPKADGTTHFSGIEILQFWSDENPCVQVGRRGQFSSIECALDSGWFGTEGNGGIRLSPRDTRRVELIAEAYEKVGLY